MEEEKTEGQDYYAEEDSGYFSFFIPHKKYFITPVLIYLNIGFFIYMIANGVDYLQPDSSDIIDYGALFRYSLIEGEYWRLFSSLFLHIGLLHLAVNIFSLFFIGFFLEPIIGSVSFLIFYLLTGLIGSIASVMWHDYTISAGASGAIFGMYGIFFALLTTNLITKEDRRSIFISISFFIAYNLFNGFKSDSVVDNASHIAGLISGILCGYLIYPIQKFRIKENILHFSGVLMIASAFFFAQNKIPTLPNVIGDYNQIMLKIAAIEDKALVAVRMKNNASEDELIYNLTVGIKEWQRARDMIDSLSQIELPVHLKEKLPLYEAYLQLRIDQYELFRRSVIENTSKYDVEISQIVMKIKSLQPYLR